MRIALLVAVCVLAACASDELSSTPPKGVDLSGHWKLNEADSDDPQRILQSQIAAATATTPGPTSAPRGRQGARGGGFGPTGPMGPQMPSVAVLDEALRWPGRDLTVKQTGTAVSFITDGAERACRVGQAKGHQHVAGDSQGRDSPSRGRGDAPPPRCGWDESTLVVQSGEPDEDRPPYELRFSLSDDGERLVEVVSFKGGRSSGFTASREWDRWAAASSSPGATPAAAQPQ
ncbi:MAG TPA: hypothetical protein VK437_09000 [Steroidobacteraceae bacterium]|nr:hypothetical protein [Steroidobacteraceae bacterium]